MTPAERRILDFPVGLAVLSMVLSVLFLLVLDGRAFGPDWVETAILFLFYLCVPVLVLACLKMRGGQLTHASAKVQRIGYGALAATMAIWFLTLVVGTLSNLVIM